MEGYQEFNNTPPSPAGTEYSYHTILYTPEDTPLPESPGQNPTQSSTSLHFEDFDDVEPFLLECNGNGMVLADGFDDVDFVDDSGRAPRAEEVVVEMGMQGKLLGREEEGSEERNKIGPIERQQIALARVEDLLEKIEIAKLNKESIEIRLVSRWSAKPPKERSSSRNATGSAEQSARKAIETKPVTRRTFRSIQYPGRNEGEVWKHTVLVKILEHVASAIKNGHTVTKRDIFYKNVALFKRQSIVDTIIDDLAATFQLSRSDLNVMASPKGLIYGPGVLVPHISQIISITLASPPPLHVLVVEKEAVFHILASLASATPPISTGTQPTLLNSRTILVTARGCPDLSTRVFLSLLTRTFPHLLTHIATDLDPYGLSIAQNYIIGSSRMAHEKNITVPNARWIGPSDVDVRVWIRDKHNGCEENLGLLELSDAEWWRCHRLMEKERDERLKDACRFMIAKRKKIEMEFIGEPKDWAEWVETKLMMRAWRAGKEWEDAAKLVKGGIEVVVAEEEREVVLHEEDEGEGGEE